MPETTVSSAAPQISVVIPAYNAAGFITDALDGIARQTLLPVQVVVVNDGSKDATSQVIRDWVAQHHAPFSVCLHDQTNSGISATRNQGIRLATGDWIAFLDADDIWEPFHLATLVAALALVPSAIAAYGAGRLFAGDVPNERLYDDFWGNPSKKYGAPLAGTACYRIDATIFPRLVKGNFIKPSSLVVARSAIDTVGLFNESLGTAEDREFLVRLVLLGDFVYTSESITRYRWHDDNASQIKNAQRNAANGLRAIQMVRDNPALRLSPANRAACLAEMQACAKDYMYLCCQKGWREYREGLVFIRQLSGWGGALRVVHPKHIARSLLKRS